MVFFLSGIRLRVQIEIVMIDSIMYHFYKENMYLPGNVRANTVHNFKEKETKLLKRFDSIGTLPLGVMTFGK